MMDFGLFMDCLQENYERCQPSLLTWQLASANKIPKTNKKHKTAAYLQSSPKSFPAGTVQ